MVTGAGNTGDAKANFDHIYGRPDPRAYCRKLQNLDYTLPDAAKLIFRKLISRLQRRQSNVLHVLDLGCSYGVNAALLKHDLSMSELYDHWNQTALADATTDEVLTHDRDFFSNLDDHADLTVIGLEQAELAVSFAEKVGLLDKGLVVNLESETLPKFAREVLAPVDLVTSTGCVGYVTEKTFERLLPAITQGGRPWIGNFVLRLFEFETIQETLNGWGYFTEKLPGQFFVQRKFASPVEQEQVIDQLRNRGIDPTGLETNGFLYAEFYLSRPTNDAAELPIDQLLAA